MKQASRYTQCLLRKGTRMRVGWLPTQFALRGRILDLKIDGRWLRGWVVEEVRGTLDAVYVEAHEHDYKKQRKASDI